MANLVANFINAPSHVIADMVGEDSCVDFRRVIPIEFDWPWQHVSFFAEVKARAVIAARSPEKTVMTKARCVFDREFDGLRMLCEPELEELVRKSTDLSDLQAGLTNEEFEQMTKMLENFDACGNLHIIDFTREQWGTKWNASKSFVSLRGGMAFFFTAWECPHVVLEALSKKFPKDRIDVFFADEDYGYNCGRFTLKAGRYVDSDIAPPRIEQSPWAAVDWVDFATSIHARVNEFWDRVTRERLHCVESAEVKYPSLDVGRPELKTEEALSNRWKKIRQQKAATSGFGLDLTIGNGGYGVPYWEPRF
jgi:hypothetical protein